jgi:hypothetical protein
LSFFDETDEPPTTRSARRPTRPSRRAPDEQRTILIRRAVAGVAIVVVIIALAVGVHSCQVSSRNSALKSYNATVGSLVQQSDITGGKVFTDLTSPKSNQALGVQTDLNNLKVSAQSELQQAQNLSPPGEVQTAQQNFVVAMSLRRDGISDIASNFQPALSRSTAQTAINSIAVDMQKFLASDVVYTTQTAPEIAAALHAAGIPVGGANGETIQATSFLPDLGWLVPSYIAGKLGSSVSSSSAAASGSCPSGQTCGHALNSVSVGGVALSTGGGNTIPSSPAPVFDANFTNTGTNPEAGVTVTVSVAPTAGGAAITGQKVVAATQPGQTYDAQITLSKTPPTGAAQVTVTVEKVAGETNVANNSLQFPVTFG